MSYKVLLKNASHSQANQVMYQLITLSLPGSIIVLHTRPAPFKTQDTDVTLCLSSLFFSVGSSLFYIVPSIFWAYSFWYSLLVISWGSNMNMGWGLGKAFLPAFLEPRCSRTSLMTEALALFLAGLWANSLCPSHVSRSIFPVVPSLLL